MVNKNEINYFFPGPNQDSDKRVSTVITQQQEWDFKDIFNGIGCFDGMFLLQLKLDRKPYQGTPKTCSLCPAKGILRGVKSDSNSETS